MVVNLIIAVICDAVHVLGSTSKEGLHGSFSVSSYAPSQARIEEAEVSSRSSGMICPPNTTELRLGELQMQLDEMVLVQEEMKKTIALLIDKLRENAYRDAKKVSTPVEDTTGEVGTKETLSSRTLPTSPNDSDSFEEQLMNCGPLIDPDRGKMVVLGSKTM